MNKRIVAFFFVMCFCATTYAQFDSSRISTTIKSIHTMWDGALIILEGYLIKRLDEQGVMYVLRDETDRIEVKIDYKDFKPLTVDAKTRVKLWGSVDVLWPSKKRRVNVDYVELLSSSRNKDKGSDNSDSPCNEEKHL